MRAPVRKTIVFAVTCAVAGLFGSGCQRQEQQTVDDAGPPKEHSRPKSKVAASPEGELFKVPLGDSVSSGANSALVTAVLFGDFTDPGSGELYEHLRRLRQRQPAKFRWVFKNFPRYPRPELPMQAARLAVLAGDQRKFERLATGLFGLGRQLNRAKLSEVAQGAGFSVELVSESLTDEVYKQRVIADRRLAVRLGLRHAPAVFLNGRRFTISSFQDLENRFEQESRRAEALLQRGVAPDEIYRELTRRGRVSAWLPKQAPVKLSPGNLKSPGTKRTSGASAAGVDKPEMVFVEPGSGPGLGPKNAPVQLVIFADLECSFCSMMISKLGRLHRKYPQKLRISLRQLPAVRRKEVKEAEILLVASAAQKSHWSLVERVYANHKQVDRQRILAWAKELGMRVADLKEHLKNPGEMERQLAENLKEAKRVGARGRPYIFVQGQPVAGATSLSTLERLIGESLPKQP